MESGESEGRKMEKQAESRWNKRRRSGCLKITAVVEGGREGEKGRQNWGREGAGFPQFL